MAEEASKVDGVTLRKSCLSCCRQGYDDAAALVADVGGFWQDMIASMQSQLREPLPDPPTLADFEGDIRDLNELGIVRFIMQTPTEADQVPSASVTFVREPTDIPNLTKRIVETTVRTGRVPRTLDAPSTKVGLGVASAMLGIAITMVATAIRERKEGRRQKESKESPCEECCRKARLSQAAPKFRRSGFYRTREK